VTPSTSRLSTIETVQNGTSCGVETRHRRKAFLGGPNRAGCLHALARCLHYVTLSAATLHVHQPWRVYHVKRSANYRMQSIIIHFMA
jgi:hypothetical protein